MEKHWLELTLQRIKVLYSGITLYEVLGIVFGGNWIEHIFQEMNLIENLMNLLIVITGL